MCGGGGGSSKGDYLLGMNNFLCVQPAPLPPQEQTEKTSPRALGFSQFFPHVLRDRLGWGWIDEHREPVVQQASLQAREGWEGRSLARNELHPGEDDAWSQERVRIKRQQPGRHPNLFYLGRGGGWSPGEERAPGPFTARLVHWHCFLSPVASSRQAALEGWRRAQCAELQMHHLPGRPAPRWLEPVASLFDW